MTLAQLLTLYAPLVGMLGLAFWVGVLSERIRSLRDVVAKLQDHHFVSDAPAVVKLAARVENMDGTLSKLVRGMEGVQRQLANLMHSSSGGTLVELRSK